MTLPALIPRPQRLRVLGGGVRLSTPVAIRIGLGAATALFPVARRLRDRLRDRGIRSAVVLHSTPLPAGPGIHLGLAHTRLPANPPSPDEVYGLRAEGSVIHIEGHGVAGAHHGVSTLLQLVKAERGSLLCLSGHETGEGRAHHLGVLLGAPAA